MKEKTRFVLIAAIFLATYFFPVHVPRVQSAILEGFFMLREYAREHVLFCLVPAFFIAGAISTFISQASVIKYFGAGANKVLSYGVASISGTILAVCSCTVLPMFAGISRRGAGIGPATAFLYSGPAVNILAIILTARVLGWQVGIARAVGAILFSIVIGLLMALIFRKDEKIDPSENNALDSEKERRPLWKNGLYFLTLVMILIFAAWGKPKEPVGLWNAVYSVHWILTGIFLLALVLELKFWFQRNELGTWTESTWLFARQILPLLFAGVLVAGFLMGRPNTDSGIIPSRFISSLVGGNSIGANFLASVSGALMYFATLTEIPILQGLIGSGMGKGPALALLLAGPALSLPSMLVIRTVIGTKKMLTYVCLVVIMATLTGFLFGAVWG